MCLQFRDEALDKAGEVGSGKMIPGSMGHGKYLGLHKDNGKPLKIFKQKND